nr:hypothetical protein [Acetobacter persici]
MSRPPAKPTPRRAKAAKTAAEIDAQSYSAFVGDLKQKIAEARYRASLSVNRELILSTGASAVISWPGRGVRVGAPRSSTAWLRISAGLSLK